MCGRRNFSIAESIENNGTSYVWMKASKYVDVKEIQQLLHFIIQSDSEYDCNNGTGD